MTRDEKIAQAQAMRSEGATLRVIGEHLGVGNATVWKWLNPERTRLHERRRLAAKEAWNRSGVCECGAKRRQRSAHCQACNREIQAVGRAMRCERVYEFWHAGLALVEIARQLGSTRNSVGTTIVRMRDEAWDMPYRHGGYPR